MIKILNLLIFGLTSSFVVLWLYLFFSRKLRHITLYPIETLEAWGYLKTLLIFSSSLFILILILFLSRQVLTNKKSILNTGLHKFSVFIDKINIFFKSYVMLFDFLGLNYTGYLIKLAKWTLTLTQRQSTIILLCFISLPRIIILFTFLLEICLGKLHYFFYVLFLLLVPLVFRLVIFMLTDVGPRLFPEFDNFVKKTHKKYKFLTKDGLVERTITEFSFREDVADLLFDEFANKIYYPLMEIGPHMKNNILPKYINIAQYTLICYFFILSCGLIYILYFN